MTVRKVICALDTVDIDEAVSITKRLASCVGAFKIGHALTLQHGLDVISRIQDAGAKRVFLDLKFHDIPNSVGLAVREATRRGVWMLTMHISGGPAMMEAAVQEAMSFGEEQAPYLIGVSVLTSLDQHTLTDHLGVDRTIEDHMVALSKLAVQYGLDGVVCSPHEIKPIRAAIGHACIVTPGIRPANVSSHDQKRFGTAQQALSDGADYLVIGRALTHCEDIDKALVALGFETVGS